MISRKTSAGYRIMKAIVRAVRDGLYPPFCHFCGNYCGGEEENEICSDCLSQIQYIQEPLCERCGKSFTHEFATEYLCGDCLKSNRYFSRARAVGMYNGILRKAVHLFKYQLKNSLARPLGTLMVRRMESVLRDGPYHTIMPVPLHPKRLRSRGFNQALSLARFVSNCYSIPLDRYNLVRTRWTHSQVGLSVRKRRANVRGAFMLLKGADVKRKHILLVDDVYTSGSTVDECSRVLVNGGAQTVQILTLARAS